MKIKLYSPDYPIIMISTNSYVAYELWKDRFVQEGWNVDEEKEQIKGISFCRKTYYSMVLTKRKL